MEPQPDQKIETVMGERGRESPDLCDLTHPEKPYLVPIPADYLNGNKDLLEGKRFFVVRGFMKSGTNWLGRILNLHPQISCTGEFHWQSMTSALLENVERANLYAKKPGLRHEVWLRLDRFIKESIVLANHPAAIWVGDRTPAHITPSIIRGAKTIHLIRDGRDVLISRAYHFFNNPDRFPLLSGEPENQISIAAFRDNPSYFAEHPHRLLLSEKLVTDTAETWSESVQVNRQFIADMAPSMGLTIRYEDLHEKIEEMRTLLYTFLEVDPRLAAALNYETSPGFLNEKPNRFLRKGIVGDWKNYATPQVRAQFNSLAGETLVELGYADDLEW